VDIIHSDVSLFVEGGFGIKQSIGHLDQWPNGGDNHPACIHVSFDYFFEFGHKKFLHKKFSRKVLT
jgi:hypothetical protein